MKLVAINTLAVGSTGNIMYNICNTATKEGIDCFAFYGKWKQLKDNRKKCEYFGYALENLISAALSRITGLQNCFSVLGTYQLIRKIRKIKPDCIHLHNIHLNVINIPLLMNYIKKEHIPVIWTLHDCWTFTGHCTHFVGVKCNKWQSKCYKCPLYKSYPISEIDNSRYMFYLKKKWFLGIENLILVTPSEWLAHNVKRSFLKMYPLQIINNGIDLEQFKIYEKKYISEFLFPENKYLVLGVAFQWNRKKGLDIFLKLSELLDSRFQIILVGTDEEIDRILPDNIISIHKTTDQLQLAQIYSVSDVFVNPTREDTFPTVNIEALACGTPVITFNTGGGPEILDETCGCIVEENDIERLVREIIFTCVNKPYSIGKCRKRAEQFNKIDKYLEYVELYSKVNK